MSRHAKIIIYGGAFNPPHIGHAVAIETAMRQFDADEIYVVPSADRKDKKIGVSGEHRVKMLQIMLKEIFQKNTPDKGTSLKSSVPKIRISKIDLELGPPTATIKTLEELQKRYPKHKFYFLIGSENIRNITKFWVSGRKLIEQANFIAIKKPGDKFTKKLPKNITLLDKDVAWIDMSSTLVRKLFPSGHSGIPYITKGVSAYIKKHRLYK